MTPATGLFLAFFLLVVSFVILIILACLRICRILDEYDFSFRVSFQRQSRWRPTQVGSYTVTLPLSVPGPWWA